MRRHHSHSKMGSKAASAANTPVRRAVCWGGIPVAGSSCGTVVATAVAVGIGVPEAQGVVVGGGDEAAVGQGEVVHGRAGLADGDRAGRRHRVDGVGGPGDGDELLFIIAHQAYELWFKQLLHELDRLQQRLDGTETAAAERAPPSSLTPSARPSRTSRPASTRAVPAFQIRSASARGLACRAVIRRSFRFSPRRPPPPGPVRGVRGRRR